MTESAHLAMPPIPPEAALSNNPGVLLRTGLPIQAADQD
jgi:hypothetical protein